MHSAAKANPQMKWVLWMLCIKLQSLPTKSGWNFKKKFSEFHVLFISTHNRFYECRKKRGRNLQYCKNFCIHILNALNYPLEIFFSNAIMRKYAGNVRPKQPFWKIMKRQHLRIPLNMTVCPRANSHIPRNMTLCPLDILISLT